MDKLIEVIQKYPFIVAGGVIVLLFLAGRKPAQQSTGGADYSATLASLDITSRTNVALAEIGVKRDAVVAQTNAMAAENMAAINLGAMDYYKADRQASMFERVQQINQQGALVSQLADNASAAFQSVIGQQLAIKDLDNQAYQLATDRGLGYTKLAGDQQLALTDASNAFEVAKLGMSYQRANQVDANNLAYNLESLQLPFEERMFTRQMQNLENLYWRQYQTAKQSAKWNFLGGLTNTIGNLAGQGIAKIPV